MFRWITRGNPSKATTEDKGRCSSSSDSSSNEPNDKFNMIDHHNFHNSEEVVAFQRRDIVKIFVNYEEYGLLAIGTLGYDSSSGVEPEFELFEIRPGALEEVRQEQQAQRERQEKNKSSSGKDDNSMAPCLAAKKKVFPLEGLTHIPHISAGFLKSSRLVDRLLHPLKYLGSRSRSQSRRGGSSSLVPWESEESLGRKASLFKELVSRGLGIGSGSKDRRYATSSKVKLQITNDVDELGTACSKMPARSSSYSHKSKPVKGKEGEDRKPKKPTMSTTMTRLLHFPCVSAADVDEEDNEEEDENDEEDDGDDRRDVGGGAKVSTQCCPANLDQSRTQAEKEYKIRTDSDYVVLEL